MSAEPPVEPPPQPPSGPSPSGGAGSARSTSARGLRRIEPVSEESQDEALFDPMEAARPITATVMLAGPLLAAVGVLGWLRLTWGVPLSRLPAFEWEALSVDFMLLLGFVLPHSLLARGFGRRWLNKPFGPAGERPLYVLIAGLGLVVLVFGWRNTGPVVWDHDGVLKYLARGVWVGGLLLASWGTLVAGSARTLGLPHLRALERGLQPPPSELVALPPYRYLRHPVNLGMLMILLGMSELSLDRALLLVVLAAWIVLTAAFEERDAEITFGEAYRGYRQRTPRWIPRVRPEDS